MRDRDQEWRDLLAGSPVIRPWELFLMLGNRLEEYKGVRRKVFEQAFLLMGYRPRPVHPLQLDHDREVWVRESWESDLQWPDLSDDPILAAVTERYVASCVAKSVH